MHDKKAGSKKKTIAIIAVALVLVLGTSGFLLYKAFGFGGQSGETTYSTSQVSLGTLAKTISGSGSVSAGTVANVDAAVSGTVLEILVSKGTTVTAGDTLFILDSDSVDEAAAQAKNEVTRAQAQLSSAQAQLSAAKSSSSGSSNTTSTQGVNTSRAQQIAQANASVIEAQTQLSGARTAYATAVENQGKTTVTAPIDGVVSSLNINVGDSVGSAANSSASGSGTMSTGDTSSSSAVVISDFQTSMLVAINVAESEVSLLKNDQKADITFSAFEDLTQVGTVTSISTDGSASNGVVTFAVAITLDNPDARLRPGMNASALITLEKVDDALIVDNAAISSAGEINEDGTRSAVVRVMTDQKTQKIEEREVVIGLANDTKTQVISGLEEGEIVVTGTIDTSATQESSQEAGGGMGGGMPTGGERNMNMPSGGPGMGGF